MQWEDYRDLLGGQRLPCLLLNLDGLDHNIREVLRLAQNCGKTLRLATKSLRVPGVIRYIREQAPQFFRGLMCYTVEEAAFLRQTLGESDLLVAYPTARQHDLDLAAELTAAGVKVTLMADCAEHLRLLDEAGRRHGVVLRACLDLDMSYRPVGDALHVGVRRSPLRSVAQLRVLLGELRSFTQVRLVGLMGYEAQVAGLPDWSDGSLPQDWLMGKVKGLLKYASINHIRQFRREVAQLLREEGFALEFFNGGGSGSLITTPLESAVTEVTAGSVFFLPHLFDHYHHHRLMEPALFFALQVSRRSDAGFVTCAGGGYIASGAAAKDRLPQPWLPEGLALTDLEGAGEVQTPLRLLKPVALGLGEPVLFRHAKAGELAEHFNKLLLVRERAVVGEELTYRGYGKAFL